MRATWSPVLILAFSRSRTPTLSALLCSWEQDRVVATPPFEFSSVKMTWSGVVVERHRRISEMN
jgi:hypothetical protein